MKVVGRLVGNCKPPEFRKALSILERQLLKSFFAKRQSYELLFIYVADRT